MGTSAISKNKTSPNKRMVDAWVTAGRSLRIAIKETDLFCGQDYVKKNQEMIGDYLSIFTENYPDAFPAKDSKKSNKIIVNALLDLAKILHFFGNVGVVEGLAKNLNGSKNEIASLLSNLASGISEVDNAVVEMKKEEKSSVVSR